MTRLRNATGLGLLLFTATMIGGLVGISQAQGNGGGVTLAGLAGKFKTTGSGFYTVCFNESFTTVVDCASSPHEEVRFNATAVAHNIRDAAGNSCGVTTLTSTPTDAAVYGTKFPGRVNFTRIDFTRTNVSTTTSFDPTTGSGTASFSQYHGGSCVGAAFDSTGAILTGTGTQSFMVSDSGNRIETITTSVSFVTSPFGVPGMLKETMPVNKTISVRESD
jgi:hypothetical protein